MGVEKGQREEQQVGKSPPAAGRWVRAQRPPGAQLPSSPDPPALTLACSIHALIPGETHTGKAH